MARLLRAAGHKVFTPTLTGWSERAPLARHGVGHGLGIETVIADIAAVLECEELTDVVLVGHSLAGLLLAGLAGRVPGRIRRLTFLDAALVQNGRCALDGLPKAAAMARLQGAEKDGCLPPRHASDFGLSDLSQQEWVQRRLTP